MKYYFDIVRSRSPILDNSVHTEIITRIWYDNVTRALEDQARMTKEATEASSVSNVCAVNIIPSNPRVRAVDKTKWPAVDAVIEA